MARRAKRPTEFKSDFRMLYDKEAPAHPGYRAFLVLMEGRSYGFEPLNDAWKWFKKGWDSIDAADVVLASRSREG